MVTKAKRRVSSETDFRALVREHYDGLPPQQQLVAQYLLEQIREVPFLSVPQLARQSGASEATVVRFAQSVGYSGFSGLKMDLLEALREKVVPRGGGPVRLPASALEIESLAAVVRQETLNIRRTAERLDHEDFRRISAQLFKADHVYTFGMGISSYFAELLTYLLAEIGLRSTTLSTRFSSPLEQLVALRPSDLLVAFSFPPYSRQTLELLRQATAQNIPSVAVCDREGAPAAGAAGQALAVQSENLLFTNSFAAVATLLNGLVTEIAIRHQDHAFDALSRINRILAEDRDLLEDPR